MNKKIFVIIIGTVFLLNILNVSALNISRTGDTTEEMEEFPYSLEDVTFYPAITTPVSNDRGVMKFYVKLENKDGGITPANGAAVQIMEYEQGIDVYSDYTNANGYVEFYPLISKTYIILVQYEFPKYEAAFFALSPTIDEQTFHVFLAEREGRESSSYESVESKKTITTTFTEERGDVHFFIWKIKIQGGEGQIPSTNTPVIMKEQGTGNDIVQGNTNNKGYIALQPLINKSYEIEVEYISKYEMAKIVVDPTVEDQNFNFYLLQRQIESESSKIKRPMFTFFEKIKIFPILSDLFERILNNI